MASDDRLRVDPDENLTCPRCGSTGNHHLILPYWTDDAREFSCHACCEMDCTRFDTVGWPKPSPGSGLLEGGTDAAT